MIFLPSFAVIWKILEIAKLGGGHFAPSPSLIRLAKSPVQMGLIFMVKLKSQEFSWNIFYTSLLSVTKISMLPLVWGNVSWYTLSQSKKLSFKLFWESMFRDQPKKASKVFLVMVQPGKFFNHKICNIPLLAACLGSILSVNSIVGICQGKIIWIYFSHNILYSMKCCCPMKF